MISILSGGVGAARFARGLTNLAEQHEIKIISNVGDDDTFHGLHVSPDIDTVIYTLANAINPDTGWGLSGESWRVMEALSDYGGETWFRLGDRDIATHMYRTQLLRSGISLTEVTRRIKNRWGINFDVLPATNDKLQTVLIATIEGVETKISFQEYFVQHAHRPAVTNVIYEGSTEARPTPEVINALEESDVIILAPSNPILSIGPIIAISEINKILRRRNDRVVAVSPIIAGRAVKGPAAQLMEQLGLEPSALGIARFYSDIATSIIIDNQDTALKQAISEIGFQVSSMNTLMTDDQVTQELANCAIDMIESK